MPDAAVSLATTPTKIEQRGPRTLGIAWADGAESALDVRELRLACGCAQCVDEWTGAERLDADAVPADVHPVKISGVGRYAIQIEWSDGHASGIYPFRRLRQLGDEATAKP
jgi:ATP-binding protein involved in chromosome partitioning